MKYTLNIVDSGKGGSIFFRNNLICLNLNAAIKHKNVNLSKVELVIQHASYINLCNLASLCYKLDINYHSRECEELLRNIIINIKAKNKDICFTQFNVNNFYEVDLNPLERLYYLDRINGIIYMNKVFKEQLNYIGFQDNQLASIFELADNADELIPKDLKMNLPLRNEQSEQQIEKLKKVIYD